MYGVPGSGYTGKDRTGGDRRRVWVRGTTPRSGPPRQSETRRGPGNGTVKVAGPCKKGWTEGWTGGGLERDGLLITRDTRVEPTVEVVLQEEVEASVTLHGGRPTVPSTVSHNFTGESFSQESLTGRNKVTLGPLHRVIVDTSRESIINNFLTESTPVLDSISIVTIPTSSPDVVLCTPSSYLSRTTGRLSPALTVTSGGRQQTEYRSPLTTVTLSLLFLPLSNN